MTVLKAGSENTFVMPPEVRDGAPVRAPDGTWCLFSAKLLIPLKWGFSEEEISFELRLRWGCRQEAYDAMLQAPGMWEPMLHAMGGYDSPEVRALLRKLGPAMDPLPPLTLAKPLTREQELAEAGKMYHYGQGKVQAIRPSSSASEEEEDDDSPKVRTKAPAKVKTKRGPTKEESVMAAMHLMEQEGKTWEEAATALGKKLNTMCSYLSAVQSQRKKRGQTPLECAGFPASKPKIPKYRDKPAADMIMKLHQQGLTLKQIEAEVGVSYNYVWKTVRSKAPSSYPRG